MTTTSPSSAPARDPSSLSNLDEAHVTHLSWDAVADFDMQQFFARAKYDVELASPDVKSLRLDTFGLDVRGISLEDGTPTSFLMSGPDPKKPHLGSCLEIDLPGRPAGDGKVSLAVAIEYATSPSALAAQWLPPAQTAGKKYQYVFSACFVSLQYRVHLRQEPAPLPGLPGGEDDV